MKLIKVSVIALSIFIIYSCSSVNVLSSWSSDKVSEFKDNSVLVIARTENQSARIAFENEISKGLNEQGITAKPSFSIMPTLQPDIKLTSEKVAKIEELLKAEGYDGVVISVVKDVQKTTKTTQDGGYYAGGNMYPGYYGGFNGYYYNPLSYSTYATYVPATYSTSTYKTFMLETVAYDLNQPSSQQMAAIVKSEVTDPDRLEKDAAEYTKKILKALK